MYILLDRTVGSDPVGAEGGMRSCGVLSDGFKIPKCTSHLGIGLVHWTTTGIGKAGAGPRGCGRRNHAGKPGLTSHMGPGPGQKIAFIARGGKTTTPLQKIEKPANKLFNHSPTNLFYFFQA